MDSNRGLPATSLGAGLACRRLRTRWTGRALRCCAIRRVCVDYLSFEQGLSTGLLIAIAKKRLHLDHHSQYEILQILSFSMVEIIPINKLLAPTSTNSEPDFEPNQLALF
jgi:hypothetical protein